MDALHNSETRKTEHATTCEPGTHARILQQIREWFNTGNHSVCWLRGPAGTGKSTISNTIAAELKEIGRLAGSFFFSRKRGARGDISGLVITLAYQIAEHIPSIRSHMEAALRENRTLLGQAIETQFQELIVGPLMNVETGDRSLIVIDGLDECAARDRLMALIQLLGQTLARSNIPLLFLLASRPERDIESTLRSFFPHNTSLWLALEDSRDDVWTYLEKHLQGIRQRFHTIMAHEPERWPSRADLDALVENSDGLFIYAATIVRYMEGRGSPQANLRKVLTKHVGVDPLYEHVISEANECPNFDRVIGTLVYLREPIPILELAQLLQLDISEIRSALDACHSVLIIPDSDNDAIRPYHASLRDYLIDRERSNNAFCDPALFHTTIAVACLRATIDNSSKYAWVEWYYHASCLLASANGLEGRRHCLRVKDELDQLNRGRIRDWMVEALQWRGVVHIIPELPSMKVSRTPCHN